MIKPKFLPLLMAGLLAAGTPVLVSCQTKLSEEEKTERLRQKLDAQEKKARQKAERRKMRREAQDDQYYIWWHSLMGKH